MRINLSKEMFLYKEKILLEDGELSAGLFKYDSGICAVRLSNSRGSITILPYNGQMVWDAVFDGRSLKMINDFKEPHPADDFKKTYGCYIMHCGALTMGCPSPEDDHPHHGELPYADYQKAFITAGENARGKYIAVGGEFEYSMSFGDHYIAVPTTYIYEGSALIDVTLEVTNLSRRMPMNFMYQCHINNAPEPGAIIHQTLPWDTDHMVPRLSIPEYSKPDPAFLELIDRIKEDISVTASIAEGDAYDPEIVMFLRDPVKDENGMVHYLYEHTDGTSDYTTFDGNILDHSTRWIVYHDDWKAMGMVLPGTAEPEGFLAEKAKGNVKTIEPGKSISFTITTGLLDTRETKDMLSEINFVEK